MAQTPSNHGADDRMEASPHDLIGVGVRRCQSLGENSVEAFGLASQRGVSNGRRDRLRRGNVQCQHDSSPNPEWLNYQSVAASSARLFAKTAKLGRDVHPLGKNAHLTPSGTDERSVRRAKL
jgi:hypothetical protein